MRHGLPNPENKRVAYVCPRCDKAHRNSIARKGTFCPFCGYGTDEQKKSFRMFTKVYINYERFIAFNSKPEIKTARI